MLKPALLIGAMLAASPALAQGTAPDAILDITWRATAIDGQALPPDAGITLQIGTDLHAGGIGGCNSYSAEASLSDESLTLSKLISTQRSCGYERNMRERSYAEALVAAASWSMDNGALALLDAAGTTRIIFER